MRDCCLRTALGDRRQRQDSVTTSRQTEAMPRNVRQPPLARRLLQSYPIDGGTGSAGAVLARSLGTYVYRNKCKADGTPTYTFTVVLSMLPSWICTASDKRPRYMYASTSKGHRITRPRHRPVRVHMENLNPIRPGSPSCTTHWENGTRCGAIPSQTPRCLLRTCAISVQNRCTTPHTFSPCTWTLKRALVAALYLYTGTYSM